MVLVEKSEGQRSPAKPMNGWENNIKMYLQEIKLGRHCQNSSGSAYGEVVKTCEHENKLSGSIKCATHKKWDSVVLLLFSCQNFSLLTSACWEITVHVILEKSGRGYTEPAIQMSHKCLIPVPSMNIPMEQQLLNTNCEFHL
jgi:hypothetical protein